MKLVSPNKTCVDINFNNETGYILNRRIFDYDLSRIAVSYGAEVYTKAYVKNLVIKDEFVSGVEVEILNKSQIISSKIIIGADGIDSRVGRWAGLKTNVRMKDMESCVQYSVSNINVNQNQMTMYVGSKYAPGGYLWIFPKGNNFANIGIGISGKFSKDKSAKTYLDDFIKDNFPGVSILTTVCGGVPCASPLKNPVANGLIVVGDAAHQVNPVSGGGITPAMKGGMFGGLVSAESVKNNNTSEEFLNKYTDLVQKDFGNRHNKLYKIKEAMSQLSDKDLNTIADKIASIPQKDRSLAKVFTTAMMKKPSLILDALKIFAGF